MAIQNLLITSMAFVFFSAGYATAADPRINPFNKSPAVQLQKKSSPSRTINKKRLRVKGLDDPNLYTFDKLIYPVARHPRCMNCHTYLNPGGKYLKTHKKRFIEAGMEFDPIRAAQFGEGFIKPQFDSCMQCHSEELTGAGADYGWTHPTGKKVWFRKSMLQICAAFKNFGTAKQLESHLLTDTRILWSIRNRTTPDGVVQSSTPVKSYAQWEGRVKDWIHKGKMRCRPMNKFQIRKKMAPLNKAPAIKETIPSNKTPAPTKRRMTIPQRRF